MNIGIWDAYIWGCLYSLDTVRQDISLFQALESSPVVLLVMSPPPAVLSTLVPSLKKSAGIPNAYIDSQILDAIPTSHVV